MTPRQVAASAGGVERRRVGEGYGERRRAGHALAGLGEQLGHGLEEHDVVPAGPERRRMAAGAAARIEHARGRRCAAAAQRVLHDVDPRLHRVVDQQVVGPAEL